MSVGDRPELRELFAWADIEVVSLNYRISGRATAAQELIIANYGTETAT